MRILYIGRFQPFHLGHLSAVEIVRRLSKDVVIAIGSPTDRRFFSLEERKRMVKDNTNITPEVVEDLGKEHLLYEHWGRYVLEKIGDVDIVSTGNSQVRDDFYAEGKHVLFFNRDLDSLSGTLIRRYIESRNNLWKELVPQASRRIIEVSDYFRRFNDG